MAGWVLWVILACAFGVGEMLSGGFFLAPFALGAGLPQLAKGDANKVFVIPSEFAEAFGGITKAFAGGQTNQPAPAVTPEPGANSRGELPS
jgi:hypothetical protein